jgi:hypothetical protein
MTRAGRALRQAAQHDGWRCPNCAHENHHHLEKQFRSVGYQPAVFHCDVDGCDCVLDLTTLSDRRSRSST